MERRCGGGRNADGEAVLGGVWRQDRRQGAGGAGGVQQDGVEVGGDGGVGFFGGVDRQALNGVVRQEGGEVAGGLAGAGGEDQAGDGRGGGEGGGGLAGGGAAGQRVAGRGGDRAGRAGNGAGGRAGEGGAGAAGGRGGGVADGEDRQRTKLGRQGGEGRDAVGAGEGQ